MTADPFLQQWHQRAAALGFDVAPAEREGTLELGLGGHGLASLLDEYGSPLVLVSERAAQDVVARLQAFTDSLGQSLRPRVRVGPATFNDSSGSRVFSPVCASPTLDLLRRLQGWNVGFLAQCAGEVERALRAGARPANVILCGPFKSKSDVILSAQLSLRALEVESLAEFELLCEAEVKAACRLRPLRLCLRLEAPWDRLPAGLSGDELLVVLERIRRLDHVVCVGLSASWSEFPSRTADGREVSVLEPHAPGAKAQGKTERDAKTTESVAYEDFFSRLATLGTDQLSSGHPLEFVMVGPRSRPGGILGAASREHAFTDATSTATPAIDDAFEKARDQAHLDAMRACFVDAPFRVYLSSADAIHARAVHKLGRVLRVVERNGSRACYTDVRYLEGSPVAEPPLALVAPTTFSAHSSASPATSASPPATSDTSASLAPVTTAAGPVSSEGDSTQVGGNLVTFLGRSSFDHRPRSFGTWRWPSVKTGDAILFPCTGAAYGAAASASCSLPRPPEILVTAEGDVVVIRSRETLESVLSNEV